MFEDRSVFDPPSDPEGGARVCLYCDKALEKERFTNDWVCVNRRCDQSPHYDMIFDAHEGAAEWARDLLKRNPADWLDNPREGGGRAATIMIAKPGQEVYLSELYAKAFLHLFKLITAKRIAEVLGITTERLKDLRKMAEQILEEKESNHVAKS